MVVPVLKWYGIESKIPSEDFQLKINLRRKEKMANNEMLKPLQFGSA